MNNPITKHWPWQQASNYISPISVFDPPSLFAKTMSETIPIEPGSTRLLDVGCGSGIIGIYCLVKKKARFVTFNDIQDTAILETRANVTRHIQQGTIRETQVAGQKGAFAAIPPSIIAHHNLIVFNLPQLPTDFLDKDYKRKVKADQSMSYFRLGGKDGLKIARKFFAWYAGLKKPPAAVILLSSFLGKSRIREAIEKHGIEWKILKETKVLLREIFTKQANKFSKDKAEIKDRSLERNADGKWMKKLLTIQISPRPK